MRKRSASRFCPRTRLFTDPFSRLQLFLYVQASEFACLPDRSYRCKFPCRAAEAFTSEPNVHRCLCTHRICYPPDYRQLAERGLTPRKIHSIVDCSSHREGPAAEERRRFLLHRAHEGAAPATLLRTARELLVIAKNIDIPTSGSVSRQDLEVAANKWAHRQQRRHRSHGARW